MRKVPKVNLEWALMADGVDGKDVYKVLATKAGQDRAFKKLDTIKMMYFGGKPVLSLHKCLLMAR